MAEIKPQPPSALIPQERIQRSIYFLRGEKVMLDIDLSALYGVETGALKRAVRRNASRFPSDFMFQLTSKEESNLRCQIGISSLIHGGQGYLRYAFTENRSAPCHSECRRTS